MDSFNLEHPKKSGEVMTIQLSVLKGKPVLSVDHYGWNEQEQETFTIRNLNLDPESFSTWWSTWMAEGWKFMQ